MRITKRRSLIQGVRPSAEELWANVGNGGAVPIIYRDLPYKRVQANLQVPVSCGCELAVWGRERGWRGGCSFCDIGRFARHRYLNVSEVLSLVGLILGKSSLADRFWGRQEKCLVISFSAAGEPLLRWGMVKEAIIALSRIFGENGVRVFFSICTVGVADGIRELLHDIRFCDEYRLQLRFSLHFTSDEDRGKFIPANDPIRRIVELGTTYAETVGVRLVLHYALIQGVNDSREHARALIKLLYDRREHILVRVSRINPDCGAGKVELAPSSKSRRRKFVRLLKEGGLECSPVWEGYARWACNAAHFR